MIVYVQEPMPAAPSPAMPRPTMSAMLVEGGNAADKRAKLKSEYGHEKAEFQRKVLEDFAPCVWNPPMVIEAGRAIPGIRL